MILSGQPSRPLVKTIGGAAAFIIWRRSDGDGCNPTGIFAPEALAADNRRTFMIQFMVQVSQAMGGCLPVNLNELSPRTKFRGTFPGLAYQLGKFSPLA